MTSLALLPLRALLGRLAAVSLLLAPVFASGAAPLPTRYVEGELLVKFRGGPHGLPAVLAQRAFQHQVKRYFDSVGWQYIQLPPGQTVAEALARYRQHGDVLAVEPNYLHEVVLMSTPAGVIPNDPLFTNQWGLLKIGATNAWATSTGNSNVVVAVIDSGVDYYHEDLAENMWRNLGETGLDTNHADKATNGVDDDRNGYVDDLHGIDVINHDGFPMDEWYSVSTHGTACAGIIGAVGNNDKGMAGVNWSVQLMAVRFLHSSTNVTNYVDTVGFVEACSYVLDQKSRGVNIRVTSNSWGFANDPGQLIRCALETLGNAGILNVFSAGYNLATGRGTNLDINPILFPQYWHLPSTINVASSDRNDNLASDSNWGLTNIDLAAPGVGIVTTQGGGSPHTNYYLSGLSGTSFACPHVAGAAALLAAAYPLANAGQIKTALMLTVDEDVGNLTNKVASKGRLNLARAIEHAGLPTNAPPFILVHPQSATVGLGCSATFQVVASGPSSSPLAFQWWHDGAELPNATNATLMLSNMGTNDAGDYQVMVSNDFGVATSTVAVLTVAICPVILAEPQSLRVVDGVNVKLSVVAAGACPLTYQWQRDGLDIPNATDPTLLLTKVIPIDSGEYQVVLSNACGVVTSTGATVTVLGRPLIIAQPQSQTVTQGANVTLSVSVTNWATLPIGYLWRRTMKDSNWVVLHELTSATNLASISTNSAGTWRVSLTNDATSGTAQILSSPAYVTVVIPPTNQTVLAGATVTFTALAFGTAPIRYQWQFDGADLTNATNATLLLAQVQPTDAGIYTVVVRNAAGEPTNFSARLDVPGSCQGLTLRVVPCLPEPAQWCVEICWPDTGPACVLYWTSDLSEPQLWQPWPGPTQVTAGCKCALIPVTRDKMFFRLRCE
jgi:subtilisin family serine protease